MRDPIPYTPIVALYKRLKDSPQRVRLDRADALAADPKELIQCLAASVKAFRRYSNGGEPFYPTERDEYTGKAGLGSTRELAALLDTGSKAHKVAGGQRLDFRYVDRELVLARTTGGARYDDKHSSRSTTGVRADLLLQNKTDRRPVIAEVKLATDKDPFVGLIQGLACASQLASKEQMARLRRWTKDKRVTWADGDDRVHVYVVLARLPRRSTYWPDLFDCAAELAEELMKSSVVRQSIAGIAALEVDNVDGRATTTKLFPPPQPLGSRVERARGPQRRSAGQGG
jgi:hypothetical protein